MALDKEFFDSISIEVVKKKYYNANKVEAVFQSIREQAYALNEENAALKERIAILESRTDDISDVIMTAKEVCSRMVEEARVKSEQLVASAEAKKNELVRQQEYFIEKAEESFSRLRELQMSCVEAVNSEWQEFLAGLPDEEPEPEVVPEPAPAPVQPAPQYVQQQAPVYPPYPGYPPYPPQPYYPAYPPQPAPQGYYPYPPEPETPPVDIPEDLSDKVNSIVEQILAMHNAQSDEDY